MRRDVNVGNMQTKMLSALVVVEKDPKALILTRNIVSKNNVAEQCSVAAPGTYFSLQH